MSEPDLQSVRSAAIEADIHKLEVGIRQLKVQYDMFFAGALKREPIEMRAQIERIIKRHANSPIQKYAQRFHLNTLVSRFNSLSELWTKTRRSREEGDRPPPALAAQDVPREKLVARCRLHDPKSDQAELKRLYRKFLEARRRTGNDKRDVTYQKFIRGVSSQAQMLQKKHGCGEIELRVVVCDHKVLLKARSGSQTES